MVIYQLFRNIHSSKKVLKITLKTERPYCLLPLNTGVIIKSFIMAKNFLLNFQSDPHLIIVETVYSTQKSHTCSKVSYHFKSHYCLLSLKVISKEHNIMLIIVRKCDANELAILDSAFLFLHWNDRLLLHWFRVHCQDIDVSILTLGCTWVSFEELHQYHRSRPRNFIKQTAVLNIIF